MLEHGNYEGAVGEFNAALEADPDNFDAVKNLAGAYVETGDWDKARAQYAQAQVMRPNDPSIYVNLAYVYQQLGETELAWGMIQKAIEIDPSYPLAHYRAGELFLAQGDKEQATKAFNDYLTLEPNSRLAQDARALLKGMEEGALLTHETPTEEITPEETTQTEGTVESAPTTESTQTEETPPEGTATPPAENGQSEEGQSTGEAGSETSEVTPPPEPEPVLTGDALYEDRLSRGRRMRAMGSNAAAIRLLTEAYEVHPDFAQVNYELGLAYLNDDQMCEGRKYLEKYVELETDPEARAEAEQRLNAVQCDESEQESTGGSGTG
jgi:tetratricopeptide (TPR) repeat protein